MKINKTSLIIVGLLLAFSFAAQAQNRTDNSENATRNFFVEKHLEKLKANIAITPAQEQQIHNALVTLYNARQTAQQRTDKTSKEKIAAKKMAHDAYKQQCENILTEEQRDLLQQKQQQRAENSQNN